MGAGYQVVGTINQINVPNKKNKKNIFLEVEVDVFFQTFNIIFEARFEAFNNTNSTLEVRLMSQVM